jgi:hypothetical protein
VRRPTGKRNALSGRERFRNTGWRCCVPRVAQTRDIQQENRMTTQQISFLIPPYGTATLTLPELLTPDAFARLDSAIDQALAEPRQALDDAAPGPGSIEYDSWLIRQQ